MIFLEAGSIDEEKAKTRFRKSVDKHIFGKEFPGNDIEFLSHQACFADIISYFFEGKIYYADGFSPLLDPYLEQIIEEYPTYKIKLLDEVPVYLTGTAWKKNSRIPERIGQAPRKTMRLIKIDATGFSDPVAELTGVYLILVLIRTFGEAEAESAINYKPIVRKALGGYPKRFEDYLIVLQDNLGQTWARNHALSSHPKAIESAETLRAIGKPEVLEKLFTEYFQRAQSSAIEKIQQELKIKREPMFIKLRAKQTQKRDEKGRFIPGFIPVEEEEE